MKILLIISWRNIWRNPKRTLVMVCAIAIGLWAALFIGGLMYGMIDQRFKTSIEQHISHIQMHHPDFLKDHAVEPGITNFQDLHNSLSKDAKIRAFSCRTLSNGMLATATLTRGIQINGIDPDEEAATTRLHERLTEGQYLNESKRNPVLVGKTLANKTRLREGSRLVLTFQNVKGELVSAAFRVAGIYQSAHTAYDEQNIYVLRSDLQEYLGAGNLIHEIALVCHDTEDIEKTHATYQETQPGLSIRTWYEISPELGFLQEFGQTMLIYILVIILMALAFGLVNTMLMSVYERIHELGMLMAVGMNKKRIFGMIMLETTFLTAIGAMAGMFSGIVTMRILHTSGLNLAAVGGDTLHEFGYPSLIYPNVENSYIFIMAVLVALTAFLTAIYPALQALKMKPVVAIRYE
ncbi:MAG: ABC transporter permease [Cyclobacteriaceae bacterium]|nr:ABC transporter permease [Cyclobacteriaceae bacterium]